MKPIIILFALLLCCASALPASDGYYLRTDKNGEVTSVSFNDSKAATADLADYPKLTKAFVINHKVSLNEMKSLVKANKLRYLEMGDAPEGIEIDHDAFALVHQFSELEYIQICKTDLMDKDLEPLVGLPHLKSIFIQGSEVFVHYANESPKYNLTGESAKHFKKMPALEFLEIDFCDGFTDEFIQELQGLKNLRKLTVASSKFTDKAAQFLAQMAQLEDLDIYGEGITDDFVIGLAPLKKLKKLSISSKNLTDATIYRTQAIASLKEVMLNSKKFTPMGVRAIVDSPLEFVRINSQIVADRRKEK